LLFDRIEASKIFGAKKPLPPQQFVEVDSELNEFHFFTFEKVLNVISA
jgi:hypothetical protein